MSLSIDANVDLNSLFQMNYNFDLLKGVIDMLLKNQKATNQKLADIDHQMKQKDSTINEY